VKLKALASAIWAAAADPRADMRLTVAVLGMLVIVVAIFAVLLFLVVGVRPRRRVVVLRRRRHDHESGAGQTTEEGDQVAAEPSGEIDEGPKPKSPRVLASVAAHRLTAVVLAAILIVTALVAGSFYTAKPGFCASNCHRADSAMQSSMNDVHASISCVDCHESGVVGRRVLGVVPRSLHVASQLAQFDGRAYGRPDGAGCLSCHSSIERDVIDDEALGLRMRHSDVVSGGLSCRICHESAGHGTTLSATAMSVCVRCHDGVKASSACRTCHLGEPARAGLAQKRVFRTTRLDVTTIGCGGCHSENTCDACHGIRMPHTQAFVDGGHARAAAFGRKALCQRCHTDRDCRVCHAPFAGGHPGNWERAHQFASATSGCPCHQKHPRTTPMCMLCHAEDIKSRPTPSAPTTNGPQ